ncbi:hypothetical protein [Oligella urethralis]|uniref:Lysis protein n=1 Tax=Oligella urethralis DNF00040 TaxID=1401065 RepID=A0A095Z6Y8_9BURK|nr:hypothetical protein [Oligella urethralis]KGF30480.1 hypothetical protein HMPREF2130_06585 [Oligella urethralis DNF00040]
MLKLKSIGLPVLFLVVALFLAVLVYFKGYHDAELKAKAEYAQLQTRYAIATESANRLNRELYESEVLRANEAEMRLAESREQFAQENQSLRKRIKDVTTAYQREKNSQPESLPAAIFVNGWVHEYNRALYGDAYAQASTATTNAQGYTQAATATESGILLASGVTQADVLSHVSDYGQWCRGLVAQIEALQQAHEGNQ